MVTLVQIADEMLESPAITMLPASELRLETNTTLTLGPGAEVVLRSPAASVVLEAGSALTLERGSVLTVGEPGLYAQPPAASSLANAAGLLVTYSPATTKAVTVGEPGLYAQPPAASSLAGLVGLPEPAELASGLVRVLAEQQTRMARDFMLAVDDMLRPKLAAARQFTESISSLAGLGDSLLSPAEMAGFVGIGQPDRAARQVIERISGLPDVAQMTDVIRARQAPAVHVTQAAVLVEIEPITWPPPQSGNFGIPPAQPASKVQVALNLRQVLEQIRGDRAAIKEAIGLLREWDQQHGPEPEPEDWDIIQAAARLYREKGRGRSQEAFVLYLNNKGIATSLATFKRWLTLYEKRTGERVRPGRGRCRL